MLEKMLEEIEKESYSTNTDYGHSVVVNMDSVAKIIRSCVEGDGWIPVEERLPEEGDSVLIWYEYFRYGDYNRMFQAYGIGYQFDGHWSGDVSGTKARCIAWRPLPEPYQPKGAKKDEI